MEDPSGAWLCQVRCTYGVPKIGPQVRAEARADAMAETRRRITEAAVELHGTVGPAARRSPRWPSAPASSATRSTATSRPRRELFAACSGHFFEGQPATRPGKPGRAIGEPDPRLARALDELYAYYERTESMYSNVLPRPGARRRRPPRARSVRSATWTRRAGHPRSGPAGPRYAGESLLTAALRHAIDFRTWHSLTAGGRLTRAEAVRLMTALVEAAAAPRAGSPA